MKRLMRFKCFSPLRLLFQHITFDVSLNHTVCVSSSPPLVSFFLPLPLPPGFFLPFAF
eukprot:m.1354 g.1354  ORF g.1354 m.1354 type:complete len:58 (-) comp834_c0_seq1:112-285(-)